ncbi:MAG: phospholipase D-like domain-containing protein [Pirellulales bacterium]|nr:phospholipase D-like domain-containing protein [Pirellulales bacterium]
MTNDRDRVTSALRETLDDHRLSRTERRALSALLSEADPDGARRAEFRAAAFDLARAELISPEAISVLDWLEATVKALVPRDGHDAGRNNRPEAYFSPEDECPGRIAGLMQSAQKTVDICVFTITDNRIADAIVAAQRRGIRVRIMTDDGKAGDIGSDVHDLRDAGIAVRMDRSGYHMHHKYAIFDEDRVLTGSYNWTRSAAEHNEENFVVVYDDRLVRQFVRHFESLWKRWD